MESLPARRHPAQWSRASDTGSADLDAGEKFRALLAFAAPLVLLLITPNQPLLSMSLSLVFLAVVLIVSPSDTRLGAEWIYASGVLVLLACDAILRPPGDLSTLMYLASTMLPFGLAVSTLSLSPLQVRRLCLSFTFLGVGLALAVIATLSREVLGVGRYQLTGNYSAIAAMLLLHGWVIRSSGRSWVLVLVALGGVAISAARQSFALLAVGVALTVALRVMDRRGVRNSLLFLVLLSAILYLAWDPLVQGPILGPTVARFEALLNEGLDQTERPLLWATAWDAFLAAPLVGHGLDSFTQLEGYPVGITTEAYPHNVLLGLLADLGLLGFLTVFMPPTIASARLLLKRRMDPAVGAALLLFAGALVLSVFSGDLTNRLLWASMFLIVRLASTSWRSHSPAREGPTSVVRSRLPASQSR